MPSKYDSHVDDIVENAINYYISDKMFISKLSLDENFCKIYSGGDEIFKIGVRRSIDYFGLFKSLLELTIEYCVELFSVVVDKKDKESVIDVFNEFDPEWTEENLQFFPLENGQFKVFYANPNLDLTKVYNDKYASSKN